MGDTVSRVTGAANAEDLKTAGQLATVPRILVDIDARQVTIRSAGHLPPLLVTGDHGGFVRSDVGMPIGAPDGAVYTDDV